MNFGKKLPMITMIGLLLFVTLAMTPVIGNPQTSALPAIRTTEPPREETVWMTGSYNSPTQFLPWSTSLPPGADAGMYEALFGYNSVTETVVPCIGTSYSWGVTGENLTIELNTNARWSDGSVLDADDVVYSYELAQKQARYTADFTARFDDFVKVDADTVRFDMNTGYEFSRQVEIWIMYNIPIVPQHVWTLIETAHGVSGDLTTYQYDWFDIANVPDAWKVISGPYAPVYRDALESTCAYQYREDWWGAGILYQDLPNAASAPPKYIGTIRFAQNTEQDLAFIQGNVDLYAGYFHHIWEVWENAFPGTPGDYISCWYGHNYPYQLAASALMNLAPNHKLASSPLGIKEFRQALAFGINYVPIPDAAASGYWTQAKPGFIDNNSALHAPYYDPTVTAQYEKYQDNATAFALLDGILGMSHNPDGTWMYNGNPVGPYVAICPIGWTDAIAFTNFVTEDITNNLNITISVLLVDYEADYKPMIAGNNYDFAMFVGGNRLADAPGRFLDFMRGEHLWNKNVTSWENSTFEALWQTLETADATDYANNLDEMQVILAREVPEIPGFVNGYWYAFSEYLWEGWASEANKFQQLVTSWTDDHFVIKTRLLLNLKSTGAAPPGAAIPWFGLEIFIMVGIVSAVVITGYRLKTKRE
ncbi:MAG: ABC transporter substrate-binding protein [Candidatus Lokiarchaeota archaeon]|nr:ABC transporter substrate-binding protein [Candidatus Lokiarchaeota archaeon]